MVVGIDDSDEVLARAEISLLAIVLSHTTLDQSHDVLDGTLFGGRVTSYKVIAVTGCPAKSNLDGVVQLLEGGAVGADQGAIDLRVSRVGDSDFQDPRGLFLGLALMFVGRPVLSLAGGTCDPVSLTTPATWPVDSTYRSICDCHNGHN